MVHYLHDKCYNYSLDKIRQQDMYSEFIKLSTINLSLCYNRYKVKPQIIATKDKSLYSAEVLGIRILS